MVISGLGFGGAERQVVLLSRELVRRGHAVLVYTLNNPVPRRDELAGSGVELVVDQKRWRVDPAVLRRLRQTVVRWGADLVHGFLYDAHLYARLACAGLGLPTLNSERSEGYRLSVLQRLGYRLTARLTDGVVANSHAGAAFACRLHRLPARDVHVVWNGIDLREIDARLAAPGGSARSLMPPGAKVVGVVGMIKPAKDHLLALRVCRELATRESRWRGLFVGDSLHDSDDAFKRHVLEEWRRLGLESMVVFTGVRDDVPELVASCDVLLVTSHYEGFPNVVLEAMSCGTPVATTDYSDVRRIVPFRWQVASSRSASALADIVERCHRERATVARAQRAWVERHADVAQATDALLQVYEGYRGGPVSTVARAQ